MLKKITNFLLTFFELQCFVTLFSWPILIAWGLPLSWASPLGNLLFGPLLSAFVFLGSLCIFTELFCIPNSLLIGALEYLTQFWLWAISWGQNSFLMYFRLPHLIWLLVPPACALAILTATRSKPVRIALFYLFLGGLGTLFHVLPGNQQLIHQVPYGSKQVSLVTCKNNVVLILPKNIHVKSSLNSWIQYTLLPELIKTTGKAKIDCLVLQDGSPATQQWAKVLQEQVPCTHVKIKPEFCALQLYTTQPLADQTD